MPLPPVVIELSTADAASPHAAALVAACSQSVAAGDCRLAAARPGDPEPRAVAIVSWSDGTNSHIELGVRHHGKVRWIERDLAFRAEDPEAERWRSVGLVVGTLVGEAEADARAERQRRPQTRAPSAPPAAPKPRAEPHEREAVAAAAARVWIGVDGLAGPALDDGSWRFGGGLFARYSLPVQPIAVTTTLRYTRRPESDGVLVEWVDAAAGLGAALQLADTIGGHVGVLADVERIRAAADLGAESDNGSRWLSGARAIADALWSPGSKWGLALGVELCWRSGTTTIVVAERAVGSVPTWTYTVALGLRWSPF